ncbi:MAG: pyridoxamine 5'-phosphate oxidase family protein [Oscillospiraceae bacterium]|jgi:uncharacterized pyridoxamine 5'-phosphate oxidase family protein|nr:pyridoxamine 5'-phosphate oxidase family protein [Oscillospiraceae bacterium]
MRKVYDFLKECGVFYIATVEGDQPRVRPFGVVDVFEDKLYIQTGKIKNVSKQLGANPRLEISGMAGSDKWIRLEAAAVEDDRREAKIHMLETNPVLKKMYSPDDGNTQVFYLRDAKATICSFTEAPEVIRF